MAWRQGGGKQPNKRKSPAKGSEPGALGEIKAREENAFKIIKN